MNATLVGDGCIDMLKADAPPFEPGYELVYESAV